MIRKDHKSEGRKCVSLLLLTAILTTPTLHAGDEDISPNAYNVFDPVTGYMVPADSQPTTQQGHELSDADANLAADPLNDQTEGTSESQRWIYLLAIVVLAGGFISWRRNKEKTSSNNSF